MSALLLAGTFGDTLDTIFKGFDLAIFSIFGNMQTPFWTFLAKVFTAMGDTKYVILFGVFALALCLFKRTRKIGLSLVFAIIIGTLITNVIVKPLVLRVRPYNTLQGMANYWAWYVGAGQLCESDFCFPSGHTTGATEIAMVLCLIHFKDREGKGRKVFWIFPIFAFLTGCSRIYLMVHYPTDVIGGWIVGVGAGILGYLIGCKVYSLISERVFDDVVDLTRLFKKGISRGTCITLFAVAWIICFGVSYVTSIGEGGAETIRCAYNGEYCCQNEAQVDSDKYPPINGKEYCKIHWKAITNGELSVYEPVSESQKAETVTEPETEAVPQGPLVNKPLFEFLNDPQITEFVNNYETNRPVKMNYHEQQWANATFTDQDLIDRIFNAMKGMVIGEETTDRIEGFDISYSFVLPDETTITIPFEGTAILEYGDKAYNITDSNGLFDIYIPDEYAEW